MVVCGFDKGQKCIWSSTLPRWFNYLRCIKSTTNLLVAVAVLPKGLLKNILFGIDTLLIADGSGAMRQRGMHRKLCGRMIGDLALRGLCRWPSWKLYNQGSYRVVQVSIPRKGKWPCFSVFHGELDVAVNVTEMVHEVDHFFRSTGPDHECSSMYQTVLFPVPFGPILYLTTSSLAIL
jgi:hypothetical protein